MKKTIRRMFIANRGEIARRIAQSARRLGIETVAITDKKSPPVYLSECIDIFHKVDVEQTSLYLDPSQMLAIAKQYDCQAIHPGFGFLSENAEFAELVQTSGLIWIGPDPSSIRMMASKAKARDIAESIKAPCVPGLRVAQDINAAIKAKELTGFIASTGYPILIKAALGGGGKGMRVVYSDDELKDQLERASSEALSSFGDASLILEKYLEKPRHVEVQIFGDKSGNIISFGDRDCSLQRRHQKIIEEAPAPFLHEATRQKLYNIASELAKKVSYHSAGTVEFLVDGPSSAEQQIYFLEMNTRLQVEHPVTEEVFGLDLVALQIDIACGKNIPEEIIERSKKPAHGHSIEARIYAEDPLADFFPAAADINAFVPHHGPGIRWEVGVDPIDTVTTKFDPMIAKLVVFAPTRLKALSLLQDTLARTVLAGPKTNISFLSLMCKDPNFQTENFDTFYITRHLERLKDDLKAAQKGAWNRLVSHENIIESIFPNAPVGPTAANVYTRAAFGLNDPICEQLKPVMHLKKPSYPQSETKIARIAGSVLGSHSDIAIAVTRTASDDYFWMNVDGFCAEQSFHRFNKGAGEASGASESDIASPVPGKVVQVNCQVNDEIKAGQTLLVLESMKMEIEVKAPSDCLIEKIMVTSTDQVDADQILIHLAKRSEAEPSTKH
jgi:acetyl/propionyl-CoA carboxylase alpha subunit